MTRNILNKHKNLLQEYLKQLYLQDINLLPQHIKNLVEQKNAFDDIEALYQNMINKDNRTSYNKAIRTYFDNILNWSYDDIIDSISDIYKPIFSSEDYVYKIAVQNYLKDRIEDRINAIAEYRAYFEFRFRKAIIRHLARYFNCYWFTLNFNLYSFTDERNLPLYRLHVNIPDRHNNKYPQKGTSPLDQRESAFNDLIYFQGKYSYVWEITRNNVTSAFYFDKTAQKKMDMVVYEIDADVRPGLGQVEPKYISKFRADATHRDRTILIIDKNNPNPDPELIMRKERAKFSHPTEKDYGAKEREFQYSIVRFLIRSGIFDPRNAAYHARLYEPKYDDILKEACYHFHSHETRYFDSSRKEYEALLRKEIVNIGSYQELANIVDQQFDTSRKRLPYIDQDNGMWLNYNHTDKYTREEDESLNNIISLLDLTKPEAIDVRLSIFESGFFHLTQDDNTISHIYWLPIIINWKKQLTGGAIFVNSDKRIDSNKDSYWSIDPSTGKYIDGSNESTEELNPSDVVPQDVISLLIYFNGLFADKQIGEIEETLRPTQERSAAVSIMSRNISHNIGSHVLSYLKNDYSTEQEIMHAGILKELIQIMDQRLELNPDVQNDFKRLTLPALRSLGRLLGYFQERQDYIGTFASDRYLYYSSLFFKANILDFFYADIPFSSLNGNLIAKTWNVILDYIIYSEGYTKKDIAINVFWRDKRTNIDTEITNANDFEVALPAGNTGRQGIYTILENFIRNSAKHGTGREKRLGNQMKIAIIISDAFDLEKEGSGNKFYKIEIQDNSGTIEQSKLNSISQVLVNPLVMKDGNPDEQHKGIKEIQIAAGWLRGIPPHLLNNPQLNTKVLSVSCEEGIHTGWGLKYTFYLLRPNPGLLLVKDETKYYQDIENQVLLPQYSHALKNWNIVRYNPDKNINPNKIPFRFVIIHQELHNSDEIEWKKLYFHVLSQSSVRVLTNWTDDDIEAPDFEYRLYEQWLNTNAPSDQSNRHSRFAITLQGIENPRMLTGDRSRPTDNDVKIGISDGNHIRTYEGENINYFVVDNTTSSEQQRIVFRRHNDLPNQFDDFRKHDLKLQKYLFVEGISGDSTNNRLLRFETINHLWRYKMMEAALTKVIIIDERFWKNFQGKTQEENERNYIKWTKKNIHILSLDYDPHRADYLVMKDLTGKSVLELDQSGLVTFTSRECERQYGQSHFISLHQGLLERAVKHCSPKFGHFDEQEQIDKVIKAFKDQAFKVKFRVAVHSGRSKTHILPKRSAFIQMSSLESALLDCKLSLCELLYATIQEEIKE
jgi:hypothetical protein